jgi:hypothetical protein
MFPLIFKFKLYAERLDQDNDGIFFLFRRSKMGWLFWKIFKQVVNPDDTDGDGIPNF